jgi:type IV pilus assembly protein PilC
LTGAGLGLIRGLEQLKRNPPSRAYREPIGRLLAELEHGFSFTEAVRRQGRWLPSFDIALLQAGEQSGRLETCLKLLADYYRDRAQMARQMMANLAYPVILFHLAIFLFPFAEFFTSGNWIRYFSKTFGVLIPLYGVTAFLIFSAQSRHGETWRAWLERVLAPIPVLGTARLYLALSRLAAALEALLSAGVNIIEAWELAGTASGSPALRRTVAAWRPRVSSGTQTPSEAVSTSHRFPELFANQYATGEVSGTLDDTLRRLHNYYQEEGSRKLHAVVQWTPRAFYFLVVLMIAWNVLRFYSGYFRQIQDIGGF